MENLNRQKIYKELKRDIRKHKIYKNEIQTVSTGMGEPLSRQTVSHLLKTENGTLNNVCILIGTVNHIVKSRVSKNK